MVYTIKNQSFLIFGLLFLPFSLSAQKEVYIDLSLQKAYAVENGETRFEGRISSGKSGHETPTGYFEILQKKRTHTSNLYPKPNGGARMPYMMRLTWDGVAMHQGYVPRHPASHGCVRLRKKFAKKLFDWVKKGTLVTIAGDINQYYYSRRGKYGMGSAYTKDKDGYAISEIY